MLTKEQLRILSVFKKDVFARLTFKQIKEQRKQKSNNVIQIALKEFQRQDLVRVQMTGDVKTYSLNMDNNLTKSYINLINEIELHDNRKLPKGILKAIQNRISRRLGFFILLVFGSHAKGRIGKESDLDVALIVDAEESKKEAAACMETVRRRETMQIDYHVFSRKEFLEMLASEQENVGKEIFRNNIIYHGATEYYEIVACSGNAAGHGPRMERMQSQ